MYKKGHRHLLILTIIALFGGCAETNIHTIRNHQDINLPGETPEQGDDQNPGPVQPPAITPPMPSGCITNTASGEHTFTCEGLSVDAVIPASCQAPGCGLILQIHGDTGTGLLMDANTNLRAIGSQNGYIVLSPTGRPRLQGVGATWTQEEDPKLIAITQQFASVFRVNEGKIHATGFSRGGFVAWRLLCDASNLFASVAPAAAGNGNGEVTCFAQNRFPSRQADILFMIGLTDVPVPLSTMQSIRNAAISNYQSGPKVVVAEDASFTHNRWTNAQGVMIETFEHSYETNPAGPWGNSRGHCFPGSTMNPFDAQYALPCQSPNAFTWGEEVLKFFQAHPK